MAESWLSSEIRCPFYRFDDSKTIGCMGFTDDSRISIIFNGKGAKDQQARIFCKEHYGKCEMYRMLMGSWDYD